MKTMKMILLAVVASLLLAGTSLAGKPRGIARMKMWLQPNPYGLDTKSERKAMTVMRRGIDRMTAVKGAMTASAWGKFQTRAARIDGAAEAGVALKPVYRNRNVVGGTLTLESVIGKGRAMQVGVARTESGGFKVTLNNGRGIMTRATVPGAAGSLRSASVPAQSLGIKAQRNSGLADIANIRVDRRSVQTNPTEYFRIAISHSGGPADVANYYKRPGESDPAFEHRVTQLATAVAKQLAGPNGWAKVTDVRRMKY